MGDVGYTIVADTQSLQAVQDATADPDAAVAAMNTAVAAAAQELGVEAPTVNSVAPASAPVSYTPTPVPSPSPSPSPTSGTNQDDSGAFGHTLPLLGLATAFGSLIV